MAATSTERSRKHRMKLKIEDVADSVVSACLSAILGQTKITKEEFDEFEP